MPMPYNYYSPTVPSVPSNMLPSTSAPAASSSYAASVSSDSGFRSVLSELSRMAAQNTATSAQQAQKQMDFQVREREAAEKFNAAEAQKVRDWQEQLAGSAHQREVKDLIAAGLNPVLSALSGNGAQTPSGATASSQAQSGAKGSVDTAATQGFVSLLGSMMSLLVQQENARLSAQTNLAIADKNNAMAELVAQINNAGAMARTEKSGEYSLEQQKREAAAAYARAILSGEYGLKAAAISGEYGIASSRINADSALERLIAENQFKEYMAKTYPDSMSELLNLVISGFFGDSLGDLSSSSRSMWDSLFSAYDRYKEGKDSYIERSKSGGSGRGYNSLWEMIISSFR